MIDRQMRYRDGLDAWRAGLGLSPHAPVIPDRGALAGFRDAFEAAERWSIAPDREFSNSSTSSPCGSRASMTS